jgi:chorismate dehydratase
MNIHVGYIPYLNMVPFHQGFGPQAFDLFGHRIVFRSCSPRALGLEAERGAIDAGALSLVDFLRLSDQFEPIGDFGIGVRRPAKSVLFFSKGPLSEFRGICAVTDETATSILLLQTLLEKRHGIQGVAYGRVASSALFDGSAEGLLLIGDEAIQARLNGVKGLPYMTDLGEEWHQWQGVPFVFARWAVRKNLPDKIKSELSKRIEKSLESMVLHQEHAAREEANLRGLPHQEICDYWDGFSFRLSREHHKSIQIFEALLEKACLTT